MRKTVHVGPSMSLCIMRKIYIHSFGYACWCEPGTYVRIRFIDLAVRHMALRLATEQLFGDWCGKGLPAMSNEKSHRTDPKALGPRAPTPCNTQWGSNCAQNWVGDIRITWILFWPGPTLIYRLKFCSLWGAGSLTTTFEIDTFILFSTWDTLWHTDTHNWIMYQTLGSRGSFCYLDLCGPQQTIGISGTTQFHVPGEFSLGGHACALWTLSHEGDRNSSVVTMVF